MANDLYDYGSRYGGYSSLADDPYLSGSRYSTSNPLASSEVTRYSSAALDLGSERVSSLYPNPSSSFSASKISGGIGWGLSMYPQTSWTGFDGAADVTGKRSAEALYHQTILGSHNTIGHNEALFSTNSLVKRPRIETASNLPIYPQRPGEKDCAHYMLTRTCKFGEACKFDHPIWVPEGGIPDWKEAPLVPSSESLPERPGEPDCPYFMKTQKCKFGFRCKFNHPKEELNAFIGGDVEGAESADISMLPERPSEPVCSFYAKTGKCKFGANCKFHHPKELQIPSTGQQTGTTEQIGSVVKDVEVADGNPMPTKTFVPFTPALLHNSKGLPIRLGEPDCPFYLRTGSCKYGATCRYNHPDRSSINPSFLGNAIVPSPAANLPIGLLNPAASLITSINPFLAQASLGVGPTSYPQRPGQLECDFYMKTGQCKFGERCKFHHPIDRSTPTASETKQAEQTVKLTLAGLPRREGSVACPFYMKTGTCKYGITCRFDHPPPGEAVAMAAVQGSGTGADATTGEEEKDAAGPAE